MPHCCWKFLSIAPAQTMVMAEAVFWRFLFFFFFFFLLHAAIEIQLSFDCLLIACFDIRKIFLKNLNKK